LTLIIVISLHLAIGLTLSHALLKRALWPCLWETSLSPWVRTAAPMHADAGRHG